MVDLTEPGSGNVTETAQKNFRCLLTKLDTLRTENDRLRLQLDKKIGPEELALAVVPKGTVIALNVPLPVNPETKHYICPEGWRPFAHGVGRMIIGAGNPEMSKVQRDENGDQLKERFYHNGDGMQENRLTIDQMPKHKHSIRWMGSDTAIDAPDGSRRGVTTTTQSTETGFTGMGEAFSNMPPYMPLYFCVKI